MAYARGFCDHRIHWRKYAALGGDELTREDYWPVAMSTHASCWKHAWGEWPKRHWTADLVLCIFQWHLRLSRSKINATLAKPLWAIALQQGVVNYKSEIAHFQRSFVCQTTAKTRNRSKNPELDMSSNCPQIIYIFDIHCLNRHKIESCNFITCLGTGSWTIRFQRKIPHTKTELVTLRYETTILISEVFIYACSTGLCKLSFLDMWGG